LTEKTEGRKSRDTVPLRDTDTKKVCQISIWVDALGLTTNIFKSFLILCLKATMCLNCRSVNFKTCLPVVWTADLIHLRSVAVSDAMGQTIFKFSTV
jgi:hypothetical protein